MQLIALAFSNRIQAHILIFMTVYNKVLIVILYTYFHLLVGPRVIL